MNPVFYILGIIISLTILVVGVWNYQRKSGVNVRGSFSIVSSRSCVDRYVSGITLENQKDRVVTLFGIYLQIGHAYHIQIEDFEDSPFLLKPYETFHKEYGPIEFYAVSTKKVDFNELLNNDKVRKRLVLSTSLGRYAVRKHVRRWIPIVDFFKNHMAAMAKPIPSTYKEKPLGSNVKFVVEISVEDGREEIIPIHSRDYELQIFRSFRLTSESLESKESLEQYLRSKQMSGILSCKKLAVHDVDAWRAKVYDFYKGPKIKMKNYGVFKFYVIGRLYTWYSVWKIKQKSAAGCKKLKPRHLIMCSLDAKNLRSFHSLHVLARVNTSVNPVSECTLLNDRFVSWTADSFELRPTAAYSKRSSRPN